MRHQQNKQTNKRDQHQHHTLQYVFRPVVQSYTLGLRVSLSTSGELWFWKIQAEAIPTRTDERLSGSECHFLTPDGIRSSLKSRSTKQQLSVSNSMFLPPLSNKLKSTTLTFQLPLAHKKKQKKTKL